MLIIGFKNYIHNHRALMTIIPVGGLEQPWWLYFPVVRQSLPIRAGYVHRLFHGHGSLPHEFCFDCEWLFD
jgi:hypothetical protein